MFSPGRGGVESPIGRERDLGVKVVSCGLGRSSPLGSGDGCVGCVLDLVVDFELGDDDGDGTGADADAGNSA